MNEVICCSALNVLSCKRRVFDFSQRKTDPHSTRLISNALLSIELAFASLFAFSLPSRHFHSYPPPRSSHAVGHTLPTAYFTIYMKPPIHLLLTPKFQTPTKAIYLYSLASLHSKVLTTMASFVPTQCLLQLLFVASLFPFISAARRLAQDQQPLLLQYHNGPLLSGKISINLIWYGKFKPSQRAIVSDFITSLSSSKTTPHQPSVAAWWNTIDKYYLLIKSKKSTSLGLSLGTQILDENYSLGKSLTSRNLKQLAAKGQQSNAINVVLTSSDVAFAYIWVGNSETQCPGQCAWPFHQPIYGPQSPPLSAPNNDVGMEGIVMNLASLLAGTYLLPALLDPSTSTCSTLV
ncbi:unnamed protein product, partial [Vitis vinifera]